MTLSIDFRPMAINIFGDLWQFSDYIAPAGISIHQYLLAGETPAVFCTGTVAEAERNLPEIDRILGGRDVEYILVSHNESDEDGALGLFHERYPDAVVVCSSMTARELPGYGYRGTVMEGIPGDVIRRGGLSLRFLAYPSEVHMNDGLLFFEENSRIFYSSDLFFAPGETAGKVKEIGWEEAIQNFGESRIPAPKRDALALSLKAVSPLFVAAGHGACLDCSGKQRY